MSNAKGPFRVQGERVSKPFRFTFDGRAGPAREGDTVASALLAHGETLLARSFKFHRPRGVLTCGPEEPNALVTVIEDGIRAPNQPSTTLPARPGLIVESQNAWPNLALDLGEVNGLASRFLSAGFYYKTFMGPRLAGLNGTRFWMLAERFIRRAAGLGRAGGTTDPKARHERMNAFCDVLVIGSGPAGLTAALSARDAGHSVIILDSTMSLADRRFGPIRKPWHLAMQTGRAKHLIGWRTMNASGSCPRRLPGVAMMAARSRQSNGQGAGRTRFSRRRGIG